LRNVVYKFSEKVINFFIIYFYVEINKVIYAFICIKNYFFREVLFFRLFKLISFTKVTSIVNSLKNLKINFKINKSFNFFKFGNISILFINSVTLIFGDNKLKNKCLFIIVKIKMLFNKLEFFIIC